MEVIEKEKNGGQKILLKKQVNKNKIKFRMING